MPGSVARVRCLGVALGVGLLLGSTSGFAQALDKSQQKCVNGLNAGGAKVNHAQNGESQRCWGLFQQGKEASAASCWLSDPREKVMRAAQKVFDAEPRLCTNSSPPPFAYTSAIVVTMAGREQSLLFLDDLFGVDPDVAAALGTSDPSLGRCQLEAIKAGHQLEEALLKSANGAKRMYLKGNSQIPAVTDAPTLATMITSAVLSDAKLDKRRQKLEARIQSRCGAFSGPALQGAFPNCPASSAGSLAVCVAKSARCRGCNKLATMDELPLVCDQLDDLTSNSSGFIGPNPTMFLTPTP